MTWDAVLLDLYDTLVWSEWSTFRDLLCERLEITSDRLMRALDETRPARSTGVYPDAEGDMAAILGALDMSDPDLATELTEMERDFFSGDVVHLHPDSLPTVRRIREGGGRTALISNCSHSTRATVDRLGLEREFDAVILSVEVGAQKPDPAIYLAALDAIGVHPSRSVFVDDQEPYCDGAREVGLDTRLIARRSPKTTPANGHVVIADLLKLLD